MSDTHTPPDSPPPATPVSPASAKRPWTILGRLAQAVREQNWFAVGLEVTIVIVGIVIGFQVTAWGEARSEEAIEQQYIARFAQDLRRDLDMLASNIASREAQVEAAHAALAFYEGRDLDVDAFFEAFYAALLYRGIAPNRNTMDEVLGSGSLRLIDDPVIREALLDLYATYTTILNVEEHIGRDFAVYLYDPTYSTVPFKYPGPWANDPVFRPAAQQLLTNLAVENGLRLILVNLESEGTLLDMLRSARSDVEHLLSLLESTS